MNLRLRAAPSPAAIVRDPLAPDDAQVGDVTRIRGASYGKRGARRFLLTQRSRYEAVAPLILLSKITEPPLVALRFSS